ncbi:hypothetical protein [Bacillus velezensis]|uniref:hypothetical protein n=1 Tax=Bacillus velezensis TaxID=492670 RepID=UPI001919D0AC|nr:hypothetical protein [Bacillus velezensis]
MTEPNDRYLKTYFEEKVIFLSEVWKIKHNGILHIIETEHVIEFIMNMGQEEKEKIVEKLREIDFKNGGVRQFLKSLAEDMVKRWGSASIPFKCGDPTGGEKFDS